MLAQCRAHLRTLDRRRQPQEWAEAARGLGNNLIGVAGGDTAIPRYTEAVSVLGEAIDASATGTVPLFRAALGKMRGEALYRHGILLEGDSRGFMLADAANTLADAMELVQPHENRELWMEAATFRGAALHELGRLKAGPEGLAWMDEAATCFAEIAEYGADNGVHPIGLYNRYAVLEQRGRRTEGIARNAILQQARIALVEALQTEPFAGRPEMAAHLSELDALIAISG